MKRLLRYWFAIVILSFYFLIFQKNIARTFGELYYIYLIGVFTTIVLSISLLKRNSFFTYMCWAIFSPFAGSILGYAALFLFFICGFGYADKISIWELIVATVYDAYFVAKLWIISLAFLCFCCIHSYFLRRYQRD
jgi:hypothetical protein